MGSIARMVSQVLQWFWGLPILGKLGCILVIAFAVWILIKRDKAKEKMEQAKQNNE